MAVNPSAFGPCPQFELASGAPAVGNLLFFYNAGTTTKANTYTSSTGLVANSNPIVLNALGQPPNEIWWPNGSSFKMVYAPSTDTDPPTSPIRTWDNLRGINDTATAPTASEWVLSTSTPTYVSATSFTVPGNQTSILPIGRRLKTTNTGGTIYSTITNSVFGALTTVTVTNDSGVLDSGLSVLYYGLLNSTNQSIPTVTAATNLAGGLIGQIPYQTAAGATAFLAASTGVVHGNAGAAPTTSLIVNADVTDGTLKAPKLDGAQTGTAPIYGVRAHCSYNGSTGGTNAPTAGGNVTSITRTSSGVYTVNFTTALPHANYTVLGTADHTTGGGLIVSHRNKTTTTCDLVTWNSSFIVSDSGDITVAFIC